MIWAIIIGALVGFIASKISGNDAEMGWLANIIVGILGGFVGSWLFGVLGFNTTGGTLYQILMGVVGAVILLAIYNAVTKKRL